MNVIKFKTYEYNGEGKGLYLEFFIDGKPLSQIMEEHLGTNRGLGPIALPRQRITQYLKGHPGNYEEHRGKKYILDCGCGINGCDSIFCKITINDDQVIWNEFKGSFIDVSGFKGFVFDEHQYFEELNALEYCLNS